MHRAIGLDYGEKISAACRELWHNHHLLARLHSRALTDETKTIVTFQPAVLDACLHVVFADVHCHGDPERAFLPYRVERVRIHGRPTDNVWSRAGSRYEE